jgi:GntR family transcriptional regulator
VDETPYQIADSYYPRDVAEGTAIMTPGDTTVAGGLMAAAGHAQVHFRDEIIVRMPTHAEVYRLDLPVGTPVAEHVRVGYNREGRPVRVIITIVPGDRHKIVYEVSAE